MTLTTEVAHGQALPACEQAVLTLVEAAEFLRVDVNDLERLALEGEVPTRRIGSNWRFSCAALITWLTGKGPTSLLTTEGLGDVTAAGNAGGQDRTPPSSSGSTPATVQEGPIGEAPEERTAEDVFLRGQRVLLGPGEVVMDFGQFYARSDTQELVSVDGGVGLATREQETLSTLMVGRVGILNEAEVFASLTFHSLGDDVFFGSTSLARTRRTEVGDIGLGVRRTLLVEGSGRPDIIATINGSIPTGDSSWGVGGGLVLVKSVDPVVLFASANYNYTSSRDLANSTRLEPGSRFDVSMGYGLALNDTLAISAAVSGLFAGATGLDDVTLRQPDNFSGRFALTSWLTEGLYIEPSVSFGLSGPGQSVVFGVTVPYAF